MNEFVEHVLDVLEHCGTIRASRMFGGYGLYCDDLIFGLISGDVLYLKTDSESVGLFDERGLAPFVYVKQGEPTRTSYYTAPEEVFEDPDAAGEWLRIACDASRRRRRIRSGRTPAGTARAGKGKR